MPNDDPCRERSPAPPTAPVPRSDDATASRSSRSTGRRRATRLARRCWRRSPSISPPSPPTTRVRAVVLAANGPAFCAGHDLKELTARRADADGGRAYFARIMDALQRADAGDRAPAAAGHRRGAGRRDRGRLPAGRELRSRGRLRDGALLHARRQYRPVLLDADGGAVAQCRAQARDGDAADRRDDLGRGRARASASSTASSPRPRTRRGAWRLRAASPRSRP